jgi:hypothetical protein
MISGKSAMGNSLNRAALTGAVFRCRAQKAGPGL